MGWGLAAALALSSGCGGDDGGSSSGDDTTTTTKKDAGSGSSTGNKADAGSSTGSKADSGSSTDNTKVDSGSSSSGGDTAAIARGKKLADTSACAGACHQADFGGKGFYPNITPDKDTGIGDWTDEQIGDAINNGKDDEGKTLCAVMQRFGFSDDETSDLIAFLRSLKAKSNKITMECPQ